MTDDYKDIIGLPHPEPHGRQRMSMQARAAQFAPFAALTGHSDAMAETARLTEDEVCLYEDNLAQLDQKLQELLSRSGERPSVTITYFEPDARKSGGSYRQATGFIQKVDDFSHTLTLDNGLIIELNRIVDLVPNNNYSKPKTTDEY